jgi:hypothetical protein
MEISNKFDTIEHSYIAEKLASWRGDFDYLYRYATLYAETGDPAHLDALRDGLRNLASPNSEMQLEMRHIERKRAKFEAQQVSA